MIIKTITSEELKREEGFHPEEPCINIHESQDKQGHFWTCGTQQGPVTQQVTIDEVKAAIPNISFSDVVDEMTGDIVRILHITPLTDHLHKIVSS